MDAAHDYTSSAPLALRRGRDLLARESLPIVVSSAFVALLTVLVPRLLSSDGWLALVVGRLIARDGLPHHDTLAALTAGRTWVDQQWLGQLAIYGIERAGGIRLVLAVNVACVVGAFVAAAALARRRGGEPSTVAGVGLLLLLPYLVSAMNVRTQSFAYLPFVALVPLLGTRGKVNARRVALVLVLLAVWANVHGSVLLAAGVVALRGATVLGQRHGGRGTGLTLLIAPWLCVFVSPYHVHLLAYYADTVFNRSFSTYLSQWAPTSFSAISAPLLVLLFAVPWLLGRVRRSYSAYEQVLLGLAAVVGLLAVRNWPFAALLILVLTPAGLDAALRKRRSRPAPAVGAVIAAVVAIAALVGLVHTLSRPGSSLHKAYAPAAAQAAARAAAATHGRVYAGITFADWLLWADPELTRRVVFDVRYELLHASEVKRVVLFDNGSGVDQPLGRPTVFVLDPIAEKQAVRGLGADVRVVYKTDEALVARVR